MQLGFSARAVAICFIGAVAIISSSAFAQSRTLNVGPAGEKRVALVIGNNDYRGVTKLERAVADARTVGNELRRLGFDVLQHFNLDRRGMNQAVSELVDKVGGGGVGVIFFAGHGVQVSGSNYLLPVDIKVGRADELADEAIDLGRVMERLASARAKFTLMIIDACRDNPFPRAAGRSIGASRGLSIPSAPDGLMVVYSAGINEQALDKLDDRDRDPNGLFTREFVKQLRQPGVRVDDMVRRVRASVREQAQRVGHSQNPAIYDQSNGDFYFVAPSGGAQVATLAPALPAPVQDTGAVEVAFWNSIKDSKDPKELKIYLEQYPDGQFASLAKVRLGQLAAVEPKPPAAEGAGERAFWDSVKDTRNPEELKAYLQQFPSGVFSVLAQARLKSLQSTQVASLAPSAAVTGAPAAFVSTRLIGEVFSEVEKSYFVVPDLATMVRGAAQRLESGALKGKLAVSEGADGLLVTVAARGAAFPVGRPANGADARQQLALIGNLAHEADPSFTASRIEEELLRGALGALDVHSDLLDPAAFKELQVGVAGVFGGLGVELAVKDGYPVVVSPLSGTPAARAGLMPGDRIVAVDGFPLRDVPLIDVVQRLRGAPGARVVLSIQREGWEAARDFPIVREQIRIESVQSRELESGIGYIAIRQFQQATPQALQQVLDKWGGGFLGKAAVSGLVLDLRNDPGGLLSSAVDVAGKFVPVGALVTATESRIADSRQRFTVQSSGTRLSLTVPMVVLVNEGSASASELVAAAMQDHKRALVIGTKTFGKGTVQTIVPISEGYALKLSTAEYRTPRGRSFHAVGIQPDMVVAAPKPDVQQPGGEDPQLQAAIARLKQMMPSKF